uniref:Uncharacterized protein n=1 Tax=Sparus aurata TaxID=8175 RepID=A0A671U837_SPAAU
MGAALKRLDCSLVVEAQLLLCCTNLYYHHTCLTVSVPVNLKSCNNGEDVCFTNLMHVTLFLWREPCSRAASRTCHAIDTFLYPFLLKEFCFCSL